MVMRRAIRGLRRAVRRVAPPRRPHRLFSRSEEHRIVHAIQRAERETAGEIRVHVEARCPGNPMTRAREVFAVLDMDHTAQRNATLIYVATADRKFAVVGDEGIHAVVTPGFWDEVRDVIAADFRRGRFCEGVCDGIAAIGAQLRAYFPRRREDANELPDGISEGNS